MALIQILNGVDGAKVPCEDCRKDGLVGIEPTSAVGWTAVGLVIGGTLGFAAAKMMGGRKSSAWTKNGIPTYAEFVEQYEDLYGDEKFPITLHGADAEAAKGTGLANGEFTAKKLYKGIEALAKKRSRGDKAAGNLCSGLLKALEF